MAYVSSGTWKFPKATARMPINTDMVNTWLKEVHVSLKLSSLLRQGGAAFDLIDERDIVRGHAVSNGVLEIRFHF